MAKTKVAAMLIQRLWRIESRRCAMCWQAVVLQEDKNGNGVLVCPDGCEPGGHVSETYVEIQKIKNVINAQEVARNYPELGRLVGIEEADGDQLARDTASLFGGFDEEPSDEDKAMYRDWAKANQERLPPEYYEEQGGIDAD